jgi:hypothetical protein
MTNQFEKNDKGDINQHEQEEEESFQNFIFHVKFKGEETNEITHSILFSFNLIKHILLFLRRPS